MGKDHKIIFNLTIKDLKDLGIIKKKKKRKNKYYVNKYGKKVKIPYSNESSKVPFGEEVKTPNLSKGETFTNSTTINDDTNRLRNELAQQELNDKKNKSSLTDDFNNIMNPKLLQIQNSIDNEKIRNDMENEKNRFAMQFLYNNIQSNRFEKPTQPASTFYNPVYEPYIQPTNYRKLDDGVDTATTAGSDSFINSNIAPDRKVMDNTTKSSIIGEPPITPTTQPIYSIFDNVVTDLDNLLAPTPAPTPAPKKKVVIDPEYLDELSNKTPSKKTNDDDDDDLQYFDMTPSPAPKTNAETDIRFQPELDKLIPLGLNQKMGGGVKLDAELKLEKPQDDDEDEDEPEPIQSFDEMIEEMKTLTARQRTYLKERLNLYISLADKKGVKPKNSLLNTQNVRLVTEEINKLNNEPDVVIKAKRKTKK